LRRDTPPGIRRVRATGTATVAASSSQAVAVRYAINGLDRAETTSYVAHHLALAGRADTLFSDDAIGLIYEVFRGLPRQVNNLAVAALIAAFAADKAIVDESAARIAVAEISSE
jgi:type II secretory pathway predicted ATPase ExeA